LQPTQNHPSREIHTVSNLTRKIKLMLEDNYSIVWISGEISNFKIPSSGHAYFSLKDDKAQISAVMFKGQMRQLTFKLGDGAKIIGMGRISVYEPRGTYQIILEYVEPHGAGALQLAFEQLKRKLGDEGLFDPSHKLPLPYLPSKIGVITSPTGAVIKDILRVISRRYPQMAVDVFPVRVQGNEAVNEIVKAVALANQFSDCDLIILARGGGSFEDMAAFNSEAVARAVYGSEKPIVSAIGHETDFTIADFVADLRAPTPSAAAEMVVPIRHELTARCAELDRRSRQAIERIMTFQRTRVRQFDKSMRLFIRKVQANQMRSDELMERLFRAGTFYIQRQSARFERLRHTLLYNKPDRYLAIYKSKLEMIIHCLKQEIGKKITHCNGQLKTIQASLNALNPTAILQRGYSITRCLPQRAIVTNSNQVDIDDLLDIQLAHGSIEVTVQRKPNAEK
jgi:exodeoxyribonuclease VII large subunit